MKKVIYITRKVSSAMLILTFLSFGLFAPSCSDGQNVSTQRDIKCTVMGFGTKIVLQHSSKMILFRSCRDTTMFVEIAVDDTDNNFTIEDYYNWNIGDTVSFDKIKQDEFFRMYNRFTHM